MEENNKNRTNNKNINNSENKNLTKNILKILALTFTLITTFYLRNLNFTYIPYLRTNYIDYKLASLGFQNFFTNIFLYIFMILIFSFISKKDFKFKLKYIKLDYYLIVFTIIIFIISLFLVNKILINIFTLIFFILLCINFYGIHHIKKRYGDFILSASLSLVIIFIVSVGNLLWFHIANFMANISQMILTFLGYNITIDLTNLAPSIYIENFGVSITALCSGTDSLILFSSLFFIFLSLDFDLLNKKKVIVYYFIGIIGIFVIILLRILILLIIGVYNSSLSLGLFHTNAGWVLFLLYFTIFWSIAYPKLLIKKMA